MRKNRASTDGEVYQSDHWRNLSTWRIAIAEVGDVAAWHKLAHQLEEAEPTMRSELQPVMVEKLIELTRSQQSVTNYVEEEEENWFFEAVRLVLKAAEEVRQKHPGAHGLIPLGFLRDGGTVLANHRVVIHDQLKGNRAAIFAQSGKGKTNLVKTLLFWTIFNNSYGKLIFDYKGEYVPWTQNERGENVPGLCEHPLAKERVVLYTTKQRPIDDKILNQKVSVRRLKLHLRSILPRDFASFWPNLTRAQQEFLYTYDDDPSIYDIVLGEENQWHRLSSWFGETPRVLDESHEEISLEASGKRVIRNIRKKLQAAQKRPYILYGQVQIQTTADGSGSFGVVAPFNKEFVEAIKKLPKKTYWWDGDNKTWYFNANQREAVENLIEKFFGDISEEDSLGCISQDLAAGKLVVVDFSGIVSEVDRQLIATLITRRQFEYNLERIDLEEGPTGRVPLVIFFEEAQNLLGTEKMREGRDSIFIRTFKEGRALGIGTTSITQQPGALSKDLTSQITYSIVQHLRSRDDIRDLIAIDPALDGAESDIARRVPGNALYVDNDRGFPLPVKIDRFDTTFVEAVREAYGFHSGQRTGT